MSATRISDTNVTVRFTGNSQGHAPTSSMSVERSTNGAGYTQIASIVGSGAKTYTDTGVRAGNYYRYRIRANGAGGASVYTYTGYVYTTPTPPTNVMAAKDGTDIVLTWANRAVGASTIRLYENSQVLATLDGGATSFRIASPTPTSPHTYQLAAVTPSNLESARVSSNQVVLATNPHPPTSLAPNGEWIAVGQHVEFSWRFNTADTSGQTRFQIQTATDPANPNWTTLADFPSSTPLFKWWAPDTPGVVVWRVRTWAQDQNKPSEWSVPARFDVANPPDIEITSPTVGSVIEENTATIKMTTSVAGEVFWQAHLICGGEEVDEATGVFENGVASWRVDALANDTSYLVETRAGQKVWSKPAGVSFTVRYAAPATPVVAATFLAADGSIQIDATNPAGEPDVVANRIERSINATTWQVLVDGLRPRTVFIDHTPPLDTDIYYRVTATSELGTQATTAAVIVKKPPVRGVFLNWGDAGEYWAHLVWNTPRQTTLNRVHVAEYVFAGQTTPSVIAGVATRRETTVTAWLGNIRSPGVVETVRALEAAGVTDPPVVLRRSDYPPIIGYLSQVACPMDATGVYTVNLTHVETR